MNDLLSVGFPNSSLSGLYSPEKPSVLNRSYESNSSGQILQVLGSDNTTNPQLFISSKNQLHDIRKLETSGIGVIVSVVAADLENSSLLKPNSNVLFEKFEVRTIKPAIPGDIRRFSLASLKLDDNGKNSIEKLQIAYQVYSDVCHKFHGQKILVHCAAGLSRSVLLVACFIAKKTNICILHALDEIAQSGKSMSVDVPLMESFSKALQIPVQDENYTYSNFESS